MARLARLTLAGQPHFVAQRGNNGGQVFMDVADQQYFLGLLGSNAFRFDVAVHAYVLMSGSFDLLLTPRDGEGLPLFMQAVGRSYVRYFNDVHARSGPLWNGRYGCAVLQPERYLLPCMAYMDLRPVREGVVPSAGDYAWSSYDFYVGRRSETLLTPHPHFWSLGNTPFSREVAYADLVRDVASAPVDQRIAASAAGGWALGDGEYLSSLSNLTSRRLLPQKSGRPKRQLGPESL